MQAQLESISEAVNRTYAYREFRQPRFTSPWHYHPEFEITLIEARTGELFVGNQILPFQSGELYLIGENLPHCFHQSTSTKGEGMAHARVVQFRREPLGSALAMLDEGRPVLDLLARAQHGLRIHGEACEEATLRLRGMAKLDGLARLLELLQLLHGLSIAQKECEPLSAEGFLPQLDQRANARMSRVYAYVMQNIEHEISLPQAASIASMSVSAFSRYFHRMTNKTFTHYVNEVRIARAGRLLLESQLDVSEIAYACGYGSLSNFNRCFRLNVGRSPREYRNSHRCAGLVAVAREKVTRGSGGG